MFDRLIMEHRLLQFAEIDSQTSGELAITLQFAKAKRRQQRTWTRDPFAPGVTDFHAQLYPFRLPGSAEYTHDCTIRWTKTVMFR